MTTTFKEQEISGGLPSEFRTSTPAGAASWPLETGDAASVPDLWPEEIVPEHGDRIFPVLQSELWDEGEDSSEEAGGYTTIERYLNREHFSQLSMFELEGLREVLGADGFSTVMGCFMDGE